MGGEIQTRSFVKGLGMTGRKKEKTFEDVWTLSEEGS